MSAQYIKQAFQMLKENRLISFVSIIGTALAIALVMVMFMIYQIRTANYPPETVRNRTLKASVSSLPKEGLKGERNNTAFSYKLIKDHLYSLQTPEIVFTYSNIKECLLAVPTKNLYADYRVKWTDANFWKAYHFKFLEGKPFTEEDIRSGIPLAIISKEVALMLFGTNEAVGEFVEIDLKPHKIVAVVDNVSRAAGNAYAHVWATVTSSIEQTFSKNEDTVGQLVLMLQAKSKSDFSAIKEELENVLKQYSDNTIQYNITPRFKTPHEQAIGGSKNYYIQGILVILFLLLLPALNLTGITMNNIRSRSSEIGIRKAFGATKGILLGQILTENLVVTAIGALLGLGLSFLFVHISRSFLLTSDTMLTIEMLMQPANFIAAVFFCLLMNILSAAIPAWRMSRQPIINSLSGTPK